ncbi:hypothetical protein [Halomonas sp. TD01]|uniref:hypothetical protein n=1 Tax=Halomonas sp. TD01 TaxID=999141 RepID=UPI000214D5C1|nr:hypothetical protein [Halomonas sp. TD01]EGP19112.1 hypothetical protein GME_13135 [Halomonas sp. TD01]CAH1042450.1 hypothetical protein HPTD01_928 [Halomonas sp. TD01]
MRCIRLSRSALVAFALALFALSTQAQAQAPTSTDWAAYDDVFERGANHAALWGAGWTGIYAASFALNAYQSSEASNRDDRFDARVGVVKSALALGGMLIDRQPHQAALVEYERLKARGELSGVQALGLELAQAEQERRGLETRISSLVVNSLAGAVIAADGRARDGAVNFATGMLVSELQIWTQPNQASSAINRFQPARLSVGPVTLHGEYALLVSPQQIGAAWRY